MLTQAGVEYSSGIGLTVNSIFRATNAPARANNPIRIAEVPLNDVNLDDFSIIDLISFTVSIASLFFILKVL